jgi:hypothetical protein
MHYIMLGIATVTTVAGLGAMIVYFGRTSSIRSTMSKNYPGMSQMKISPAIMFNNQTSAYVPGVSISFRF